MRTSMRIVVAGGSGTIGVPLVRALVAAGHQVTATTRTAAREATLRRIDSVYACAVENGATCAIRVVRNPDKLSYLQRQRAAG